MMDGTITAVTASDETPTADNQANFGTVGMGYQYGAGGTVEVYLEEEDAWFVFEAVEEGGCSALRAQRQRTFAESRQGRGKAV